MSTAGNTHDAAKTEGLVPEANTGATFAETEHASVHADPTALYLNGAGWVGLAMIFVIALMLWKKVPAAIGVALDRKIADLKARLDEAAQLRTEAEAIKADYEKKAREAVAEAASIIEHAQTEAAALLERAKADAETLIERRAKMAEDKIAAAERAALADLRARAADAAVHAAADLIRARMSADADKPLVDHTIAGLGQRAN